PMLIYLFSPAQPVGGGPAIPRGVFSVLLPGQPRSLESAGPVETLAVAFDFPAACSKVKSPEAALLRGADPGVRALAHEIRRVLLSEGDQARDYLAGLGATPATRAPQG